MVYCLRDSEQRFFNLDVFLSKRMRSVSFEKGRDTMSYQVGMISLYVRDVAASTTFYTEVIGFQLQAPSSNEEFALGHLASGPTLALRSLNQLPAGTPATPGGVELHFEVEDIQAAWQEWKRNHVAGLTEISDMGAGLNFSAKDPDGHALNVYKLHDFMR